MQDDELTDSIIGAAISVHRELGPGLLESTYESCLAYELGKKRFCRGKAEKSASSIQESNT